MRETIGTKKGHDIIHFCTLVFSPPFRDEQNTVTPNFLFWSFLLSSVFYYPNVCYLTVMKWGDEMRLTQWQWFVVIIALLKDRCLHYYYYINWNNTTLGFIIERLNNGDLMFLSVFSVTVCLRYFRWNNSYYPPPQNL